MQAVRRCVKISKHLLYYIGKKFTRKCESNLYRLRLFSRKYYMYNTSTITEGALIEFTYLD